MGDFLNESGIRLKSDFIGHNLDEDTRYYPDYGTRLYDLEIVVSNAFDIADKKSYNNGTKAVYSTEWIPKI